MDSNLGPNDLGDMARGLQFPSDEAVASIQSWSAKALCPLSRIRYHKGIEKKLDGVMLCPHGFKRTSVATASRPAQKVKYTKCPVNINLNQEDDGSWCILEHSGHPVTQKSFLSHQQAQKLITNNFSSVSSSTTMLTLQILEKEFIFQKSTEK
jgi:hypothetical protein